MKVDKVIQSAIEFYNAGNVQQAVTGFKKILKVHPNNITAINSLGIIHYHLKDYDSAIQYMKKLISINSHNSEALYILGHSMQEKGELDEAVPYYQKALQYNPDFSDAYYNLGTILQDKQRHDEAIFCYQKVCQINPADTDAYHNLGCLLQEKERFDEAMICYQKALQLNPNLADVYNNIGIILQDNEQPIEAVIACCKKALEINPDLDEAYNQLTYRMQQICSWHALESMTAKLDSLTRKALDMYKKPAESPFQSIVRRSDLSTQFAVAQSWSRYISSQMSILNIQFSFDDRRTEKTKIVLGYLSNDFRNHATAHLMLSLFGLHNRDEFAVFCYSYGRDDESSYRDRIQRDCDKFIDISGFSHPDAARCIYEDKVDILIDLKGYVQGSRMAISALRPAPVQVNYLGFPGTTGADFIDYIIVDEIVAPADYTQYYSEKFVYMPHCYQVNDYRQPISNKNFKKTDFGLPENCFLFCSFNQPYKIDPVIFDAWMKILHQVPESVLWLTFGNKIVEDNLRREAIARGIKAERLNFAERLPKAEHLARLRLADLILDTRIVNGHTTTSDALWAGVPVITLQGTHFASRVSSSILSAIGLHELIAGSIAEYEALAVRLAYTPAELQEIRQKILKNRLVAPLFDTPRFVRNLETAYKNMWKIFLAGEEPRQIEVLET